MHFTQGNGGLYLNQILLGSVSRDYLWAAFFTPGMTAWLRQEAVLLRPASPSQYLPSDAALMAGLPQTPQDMGHNTRPLVPTHQRRSVGFCELDFSVVAFGLICFCFGLV